MIDDDEEVDVNWFATAFEAFRNRQLDFIGGPYIPHWTTRPPEWLPSEYGGVVGWVDGGDKEVPYDSNYPGILMGGNAVFTKIYTFAGWAVYDMAWSHRQGLINR